MTYREIRKRAARRRRYFVLIVLLIGALIFAVAKIMARAKENQAVSTVETSVTDETLAIITTEGLTRPTHPDPNAPTEETLATVTEATTEADPIETSSRTSAKGTMYTVKPHVYVRINHDTKIPLSLAGGVTPEDITWTTDNAAIVDVEPGGIVTGLEKGSCTVPASYGDETLDIPVTVRELTVIAGCTFVDGILVANKTYSLPRDYDPGLLPVTEEAFEKLCEDAAKEGLDIYQGSGYRSYDFQVKVYNSQVSGYSKEYADTWSARPGHSEHQTGYTIDCNTITNEGFADSREGKWLAEHCHEYGFIIRYPKGKEDITGYEYESWHIRYIGVKDATAIYEQELTLEEYLDIDSVYDDDREETTDAEEE